MEELNRWRKKRTRLSLMQLLIALVIVVAVSFFTDNMGLGFLVIGGLLLLEGTYRVIQKKPSMYLVSSEVENLHQYEQKYVTSKMQTFGHTPLSQFIGAAIVIVATTGNWNEPFSEGIGILVFLFFLIIITLPWSHRMHDQRIDQLAKEGTQQH